MREQPVVAHADSETQSDPVEAKRGQECRPTEEKKRGNGSQVDNAEYDCRDPVDTSPLEDRRIVYIHGGIHGNIRQLNFFLNLIEQPNRGLYEGPE